MDSSGLHVLDRIKKECNSRKIRLVLAGIHAQPLMVLQGADHLEFFGEQNFAPNLKSALALLKAA